jgi:hypothetical protein
MKWGDNGEMSGGKRKRESAVQKKRKIRNLQCVTPWGDNGEITKDCVIDNQSITQNGVTKKLQMG